MKITKYLFAMMTLWGLQSSGQDYSAIHGSNYTTSLGVYNNPSSIVNSPYRWDLTVLGIQYQLNTNAVSGNNFPFYLLPSSKFFYAVNGNFERKADINYNVRLLNGRYSINRKHAVAFGLNLRGYTQTTTSAVNYLDSINNVRGFLSSNAQNRSIGLDLASSLWMEVYGSYGFTLIDREADKLHLGASIKVMKGMSGIFAKVKDVGVEMVETNDLITYGITGGAAHYGYSANHSNGESFEASDLMSGSRTNVGFDVGVEYVIKTQAVTNVFEEADQNEYEWKIGFSLLDIGWNRYDYSRESREVSSLKDGVVSQVLEDKFNGVEAVSDFNDSLATIVNQSSELSGSFNIINPSRAVINVDRYVNGNFYINGELSVSLASDAKNNIAVKSPRLLTVTPRWETKKRGLYIPVQYTRQGNFWIGGAVRYGPLLIGTHNILNAFLKNSKLKGGGFIALMFHPSEFIKDAKNNQYECPVY